MDKITKELSEDLQQSQELEGFVFAEISLTYVVDEYSVRLDYYTVKDGIVYSIAPDGSLYPTGDSLWDVFILSCHKLGKYDPEKGYKPNIAWFNYSGIKNLLGL